MNSKTMLFAATLILLACLVQPAQGYAGAKEWNFKVYLGDSAIGHHRFRLDKQDGYTKLTTEADFKVRFLFITAYRYQHVNTETWQGDCLQEIRSHTDANGRVQQVHGERESDGFRIDLPERREPIAGCVKTFAYWDAGILQEDALLNPQTGELAPVTVELVAEEKVKVRGAEVPAKKYRLMTNDLSLDVWYSNDSEWLALESTTRD
ncbi:MAG: DUF6134 family protein, partial [Gammaproteobacteria bacterium]|nr:DUF6134 family protein [Gammaproteobacteria bacterium]